MISLQSSGFDLFFSIWVIDFCLTLILVAVFSSILKFQLLFPFLGYLRNKDYFRDDLLLEQPIYRCQCWTMTSSEKLRVSRSIIGGTKKRREVSLVNMWCNDDDGGEEKQCRCDRRIVTERSWSSSHVVRGGKGVA